MKNGVKDPGPWTPVRKKRVFTKGHRGLGPFGSTNRSRFYLRVERGRGTLPSTRFRTVGDPKSQRTRVLPLCLPNRLQVGHVDKETRDR